MILIFCHAAQGQLIFEQNATTGALDRLHITCDGQPIDFLLRTDGSQYPWIDAQYAWGLGQFRLDDNGNAPLVHWSKAATIDDDAVIYEAGPLEITVSRTRHPDGLTERYTFKNKTDHSVELHDLGINTPLNDNYPDAETCIRDRMNAHIWAHGSSAWINAVRMGGCPPHLGLVLQEGRLDGYEVLARGSRAGSSNTRGVLVLNSAPLTLPPGGEHSLQWKLFSHSGTQDFWNKALHAGACRIDCPRFVYEQGEEVMLTFTREQPWQNPKVFFDGEEVPSRVEDGKLCVRHSAGRPGSVAIRAVNADGYTACAHVLIISGVENLLAQRVRFIVERQQLHAPGDKRDGALMVYDNAIGKIFMNDCPSTSAFDRDEGRERVGMGVLLALWQQHHPDARVLRALRRYATFVRRNLQDANYKIYSNTSHEGRLRGYNYPWVAHFYLEMFRATGETGFLKDYYGTLKAFYRQFGYGFYAIGIPVREGIRQLRQAGFTAEAESLLGDFTAMGKAFVANSYRYPKHEVNFEQSIVAPSIAFLCELYLVTQDKTYLQEAQRQMPVLEAFGGEQPSYHLHGIAIRHWDDYWFGKREMWGDVFPHYWSTLSAYAYDLYAQCTGEISYRLKARDIVRNNLCLFRENGQGSCAYLYPNRVNGVTGRFYDDFANDQDWALVYYLLVNGNE